MDSLDLPIGLAFALAQNPGAMKVFAGLPAAAQASLVAQARAAASREAMQALVDRLIPGAR